MCLMFAYRPYRIVKSYHKRLCEQILEKDRMQPDHILKFARVADRALQNGELCLDYIDLQVALQRVNDKRKIISERPHSRVSETVTVTLGNFFWGGLAYMDDLLCICKAHSLFRSICDFLMRSRKLNSLLYSDIAFGWNSTCSGHSMSKLISKRVKGLASKKSIF